MPISAAPSYVAPQFADTNLTGANFTSAYVRGTGYVHAILDGTDFSLADARGSTIVASTPGVILRNTILGDGSITPLSLLPGDTLAIRNGSGIHVHDGFMLDPASTLQMLLGPDFSQHDWTSTISLSGGFVADLAGTLDLRFDVGADPRDYLGETFHLFDWNGQLLSGDHFDHITSLPGFAWNTSALYTTGEVTLTAVPEPASWVLLAVGGAVAFVSLRRRRQLDDRTPKLGTSTAFTIGVFIALASAPALAITIPTVPVGNAGNAADPADGDVHTLGVQHFGAVGYDYRIGTTEVTNAQYAEFLNAKAASGDPLALYNSASSQFGGISRSGSSGSFAYMARPGRENMPVVEVSWFSEIRFANWLHNGQGSGDTETGAYTLLGGSPTPSNDRDITRNPGATWFLPSEDEWYKAAYHKNDGPTGNYFKYPTASDMAPIAEAPAGGSNSVNYNFAVNDLTIGGAYTDSDSPYGTFDQGGNVWEWNEALFAPYYRVVRGGSWDGNSNDLQASARNSYEPWFGYDNIGFRVATVPEPSSLALAVVGLLAVALWRSATRNQGMAVDLQKLGMPSWIGCGQLLLDCWCHGRVGPGRRSLGACRRDHRPGRLPGERNQ